MNDIISPTIKQVTKENIDDEHICCAFSDKKCIEGYQAKKAWLKNQFDHGYVFKKLDVRGKVFIEYGPAEESWLPIDAPGFMIINCFWVSGRYKGQGHGYALFQECEQGSKNKNGIAVVVANKKQPFMSDKKFFQKQGFSLADTAKPYFELWYKPLKKEAQIPKFKTCAKEGICNVSEGLSVYYTNACPFTEYYVQHELKRVADERGLSLQINKLDRHKAQNHFVPHTIYSLFYNGKFITQQVLSEKMFDRFIKLESSD